MNPIPLSNALLRTPDFAGMGYAMLANIPPIVGIYTAFFPVLIYLVFGTSKHNSMGTFAVISIMVGKTVLRYTSDTVVSIIPLSNATTIDVPAYDVNPSSSTDLLAMQVASAVAFVAGAMQIGMYTFRLGILSSLLSETLVSGFTTGAGIHVLTSQVKDLLGVHLTPVTTNFKIILVSGKSNRILPSSI